MCCGEVPAEFNPLGETVPVGGEGMPKVFTTRPGDVRAIGNYGQASNDVPAIVPDEVAAEFEASTLFRVERGVEAAPVTKARRAGREG